MGDASAQATSTPPPCCSARRWSSTRRPRCTSLGRTLAALERWAEAVEEYRACLELDPESPLRARLEAEIARLEARVEAERRAAPTEVDPTPPEAPPAETPPAEATAVDPAPWIFVGVGAFIAAAGIPPAVLFQITVDAIRTAPSQREALTMEDDAVAFAVTADVLFAIGGAVGVAGLVWGLITLASGSETPAVSLRPSPTGASIAGAF
ncbi:MAG: tetratricopeptide repeat protein [Sandaracinaceae bacterium]